MSGEYWCNFHFSSCLLLNRVVFAFQLYLFLLNMEGTAFFIDVVSFSFDNNLYLTMHIANLICDVCTISETWSLYSFSLSGNLHIQSDLEFAVWTSVDQRSRKHLISRDSVEISSGSSSLYEVYNIKSLFVSIFIYFSRYQEAVHFLWSWTYICFSLEFDKIPREEIVMLTKH